VILDTNALSAVAGDQAAAVPAFQRAASIELPVIVLGNIASVSRNRNGGVSTKSGCGS
jgi:predicted nucleic acid-binding protein